ncbi:MAG: hypothetical protein QOF87_3261 [Pseudonocardiales bacterium]|nr:hypothetical protein [Pseudonocardiales bacterium]
MRAVRVVVVLILAQCGYELPIVEDQHPVPAFSADGADPPFGVGVGLRRTRRTTQHRDADISEHGIEARAELRVSIADQEPEAASLVTQINHEAAGLLGDPLPRRVPRDSQDVDPAGADFKDEQHRRGTGR